MDQDNYPEQLGQMYIVNAPVIFRRVAWVITCLPFCRPSILCRDNPAEMYGVRWHTVLVHIVSLTVCLPAEVVAYVYPEKGGVYLLPEVPNIKVSAGLL